MSFFSLDWCLVFSLQGWPALGDVIGLPRIIFKDLLEAAASVGLAEIFARYQHAFSFTSVD